MNDHIFTEPGYTGPIVSMDIGVSGDGRLVLRIQGKDCEHVISMTADQAREFATTIMINAEFAGSAFVAAMQTKNKA